MNLIAPRMEKRAALVDAHATVTALRGYCPTTCKFEAGAT